MMGQFFFLLLAFIALWAGGESLLIGETCAAAVWFAACCALLIGACFFTKV